MLAVLNDPAGTMYTGAAKRITVTRRGAVEMGRVKCARAAPASHV